jgi:hypothetical protein
MVNTLAIGNDKGISFPDANVTGSVVYEGNEYKISDVTKRGEDSYANSPTQPIFNHRFTFQYIYVAGSVGYPSERIDYEDASGAQSGLVSVYR